MKFLYVIGSMGLGGAEQHLLRVATALRKRGFQPEVFVLESGGPLTSAFIANGIPVYGAKLPALVVTLLRNERAIAWARLFYSSAVLWWIYWRHRPVVIHFFLPAAYIVGGVTSIFGPRTCRIMSRRSLNLYQAKHRLFRRIEHWLHPKMDVICGNSKAVVEDLRAEGVKARQLSLIYNGIELGSFQSNKNRTAVRSELAISSSTLVFVIVANLIPYKGHADLVDAFGIIRDRLPREWVCLCIGRDDGIKGALEEQADRLGIGHNLLFLGSRQDVPDLLAVADIGVLCSHEEGFSNAVLECMAAALPMVVTDVGGNAEAVEHGVTGLVVAPRAPAQLAEALFSLATDSNRAAMGTAGRHRVETLFSMDACVQAYIDLYSSTTDNVGLPAT